MLFRCRAINRVKNVLQASILIRHPESGKLLVNFDPAIWELISEAKYMKKIGLEIPDTAFRLCLQEKSINNNRVSIGLISFLVIKKVILKTIQLTK